MANRERPRQQVTRREEALGSAPAAADPDSRVVIDVTDAAVARHGASVLDLAPPPAATARPTSAVLRPLALLVAVNALNVVDAALTMLWIEMGIAVEANPVVETIGWPAKLVGVAAGSYVVYRLRPRWLLVPAAALTAVCVYHVVGAAVTLAA